MRLSEKACQLIKEKIITLELKPMAVIDEQALGLLTREQTLP